MSLELSKFDRRSVCCYDTFSSNLLIKAKSGICMVRITKKPIDRKSELVETARHLFQTKGYDKVTMQDVMEALDIAKGTIYHYFKSKDDLFEAVIEDIVTSTIAHMQSIIETTSGTALEKINMLAKAGNISAENTNILEGLHQPDTSEMHSRILAAMITRQAQLYEHVIKQGCKEGVFTVDNPLECAELILAGIQFLTDKGIYPWSSQDLYRRSQAFPKLLEQFLKAPVGSFDFMIER